MIKGESREDFVDLLRFFLLFAPIDVGGLTTMAENAPVNSLEDIPLAQVKSTFNVAEHAESDVSAAAGPLAKRLADGNPQVRKAAYSELAELFALADEPSVFDEYAARIVEILCDKMPATHGSALDAATAFLRGAPAELAQAQAGPMATTIVDKHLARPKALEALLYLVEVGGASHVQIALALGAASKIVKTRAAALKALAQAVRLFGGSAFDLGALALVLAPAKGVDGNVEHRDKEVRDAAAALVGEVRLALGRREQDWCKGIKGVADAKLKELKEAPLPPPLPPSERRRLRSEGPAPTGAAADSAAATAAGAAGGELCGAAAAPPFDLLRALPHSKGSAVPDTWLQSLTDNLVIGAAKAQGWQGRKAAAEQLIGLLDGREALVPADYSALAQGLKKVLDLEMNLGVVSVAVRAVGALAAPLGKDFARHAKLLAPSLFKRGGERNTQVVDGVKATLDAIARAGCLPLADAIEATKGKEAAASTNPSVQSCAVRFVKECVACAGIASTTKALGDLSAMLLPVTDASSPEARAAAVEALAAVAAALEPPAAATWLDSLPPKTAERVRELAGKTERTTGTAGTAGTASAPTAAAPAAPAPTSASAPAPFAKRAASGASGAAPKPGGASAPKSAGAPSGGGTSGGGGGGAEAWTEPSLPSAEEYSVLVGSSDAAPPASVLKQLGSESWQERLEGVKALTRALDGWPAEQLTPLAAELAFHSLEALTTNPKKPERIVSVLVAIMECMRAIAERFPLIGRRSAHRAIKLAVAHCLGNKQARPATFEALHALSEACGPTWVLEKLREASLAHANPKTLLDALQWAKAAVEAFGTPPVFATEPLRFAAGAANADASRDSGVRVACKELLMCLRVALGPAVLSTPMVKKELPDRMRKEFEEESAKLDAAPQAPLPPTKRFKHAAVASGGARGAAKGGAGAGVAAPKGTNAKEGAGAGTLHAASAASAASAAASAALDSMLPRVDLMGVLPGTTLANLKHEHWKERKGAIDAINEALGDHPRVHAGVGALIEALRPRLKDNQVALVLGTLQALGQLACAVGKPVKMHLRAALPDVLAMLADGKEQVRTTALEAADKWVAELGVEPLLPLLPRALAIEAPAGKAALLAWVERYAPTMALTDDVRALLPMLLKTLDHATASVRVQASKTLGAFLRLGVGAADLEAPLSALEQATRLKLKTTLERLYKEHSVSQHSFSASVNLAASLPLPAAAAPPLPAAPPALGASLPIAPAKGGVPGTAPTVAVKQPAGLKAPTGGARAKATVELVLERREEEALGATAAPSAAGTKPAASVAAAKAAADVALACANASAMASSTRAAALTAAAAASASRAAAAARAASASSAVKSPALKSPRAHLARHDASITLPAEAAKRSATRETSSTTTTTSSSASKRPMDLLEDAQAAAAATGASLTPSPVPKKTVALARALGRADAPVLEAISALEDADAESETVRGAIATLQAQVEADPTVLLQPHNHATALFAAVCTRLNWLLNDTSDNTVIRRLANLMVMHLFVCKPLMRELHEPQIRFLVLQLLDRLVDRRLNDFGEEMKTNLLLKSINLMMLKLLEFTPRAATLTALLCCLLDKARHTDGL